MMHAHAPDRHVLEPSQPPAARRFRKMTTFQADGTALTRWVGVEPRGVLGAIVGQDLPESTQDALDARSAIEADDAAMR